MIFYLVILDDAIHIMCLIVMLSPGRGEHRPCRVKGSSYIKVQVDVGVF